TAYEAKKPERTKNFKTIAVAAAALVVAAAAIVGVMALRGRFDKNIVEKDDNILYRSENGNITVRVVEPLEKPIYRNSLWVPISDGLMREATDVVLGTITNVTEIFFETEHKPDDWYIEGVGYVTDLSRYRSLVTVKIKDTINGNLSAGESVTFIFYVSSRNAEYTAGYSEILPITGDEYVFYLKKTAELDSGHFYIPIADYYYCLTGPCFVPYDEPQRPELLAVIGAEEGTCGEEFIEALKKYYE
ncbi:MAG: hypothetical protein ILO64_05745, partial [Clostridia bacterium]|nr:hypothetical protein [Clostridia bacterium]